MRIAFVATRKNLDSTERELYEMDLVLRSLRLKRAFADLGLLTVAACTPPDVDVVFVDEYTQPIDYDMDVDLVALSAKTSCATYAYNVADEFRSRGTPVVIGGIHASLRPDEALEHADCVVTGEAEHVWLAVVADLKRGRLKERYDADGFPPMAEIPTPAWDRAPSSAYFFHQIQTTRGCPFRCRFCSVPDISGQDFRFKPVDQVLQEIRHLPAGGGLAGKTRPLYVVDDNFISRTSYTKELLEALVPIAHTLPPWSAETTLNVATDEELLDLFKAAGCTTLILGLESIEEETLQAMDNVINFCLTFPEAIERIHSRGMTVVGNFIVGFDTDSIGSFARLRDFVQQTGMLYPFFSILTPMPGTGLFDDYKAAGRLHHTDWHLYDTRHVVMRPAKMSEEQLMDGYIWLYEQLYKSDNLLDRLERNWKWRQRAGHRPLQKAFVATALGIEALKADRMMRYLVRKATRMLLRRDLAADPGQALLTLDATDFTTFMERYKSANYTHNAMLFENPSRVDAAVQWDNDKAVKHTRRAG
jgi:radical SAM superfamily enzyme YgiQ (UPF0313 family)